MAETEQPMPTATVTPQFVNSPKGESPYASIKADGKYYSFDTRKIRTQEFNKGEAVTVEYTEKTQDDKTFYNIQRIVKDTPAAVAGNAQANARADHRDETITRLAIAKSCIEAGQNMIAADAWIEWVKGEVPRNDYARQIDQNAQF